MAGVAGVMLTARLQSDQPTAGEFYELTAIATVLGNSPDLLNVDSCCRVAIGPVIIAAAAADRLRSRQ